MDEGTEITIDTLFNNEVDAAKADEAIQSLLPPKGNYQTNPDEFPLSAFANEFEEKDGSGNKRRMITLVGLVFATIEGAEYKTRLRPPRSAGTKHSSSTRRSARSCQSASLMWWSFSKPRRSACTAITRTVARWASARSRRRSAGGS